MFLPEVKGRMQDCSLQVRSETALKLKTGAQELLERSEGRRNNSGTGWRKRHCVGGGLLMTTK